MMNLESRMAGKDKSPATTIPSCLITSYSTCTHNILSPRQTSTDYRQQTTDTPTNCYHAQQESIRMNNPHILIYICIYSDKECISNIVFLGFYNHITFIMI